MNHDRLRIVYDVADAAYIGDDPSAGLPAGGPAIGLVRVWDTGVETWGHDPTGTGAIDFAASGNAIEATCTVDDAVLELIREQDPACEIRQGIRDLRHRGRTIDLR